MTTIYLDPAFPDDVRRERLYSGDLLVYSPRPSVLAFCEFARGLIEEAFPNVDPRKAQFSMPVGEYAAILGKLKPQFIHHSRSKELIQSVLREMGCDLGKTYFEVPKLRSSTSDNYLTAGIAYAWHPHRDTWYSAPACQINWWMPIYPIESENAMAFHPRYWSQAVANTSSGYNYYLWNKHHRTNVTQYLKEDPRPLPRATEALELDPQIRLICPVGGIILFSGAQMHSSVPNTSGSTRFSMDFRSVHTDDLAARRGALNVDSACTGTVLREFVRPLDLATLPDDIIAPYEDGTEIAGELYLSAQIATSDSVTERLRLSGRRVLVTGATGFIGSHLCDRLVLEGAEIHAVSRHVVNEGVRDIRWWQADLLDRDALDNLLRRVRPDFVYHLSGHVLAAPQIENVLPAYHGLLTSTVNLLTRLASDGGCSRIILTGSLTEPPPGSVDTPPSSPYAAAKWAGAAYGRMFHSLYGTPVVLVRPYMVYGPRQHSSKVVPYTISSFAQDVAPSLASGAWAVDWIYVADLIEGLIRTATVDGIEGSTIEFGCGELTSIRDVVHRIATIMGTSLRPEFGTRADRVGEVIRTADIAYTMAKIGWKPTVSLDNGLALTVAWFREQIAATRNSSCATSS